MSLRMSVARALCSPIVGTAVGAVCRNRIPFHGVRVDTSDPYISPETKARIVWRIYEAAEVAMLRHLPPAIDLIELGTGLGATGAVAANRLQAPARYIGVEIYDGFIPTIESTFRRSVRHDRWRILHAGLGYEGDETAVTGPAGRFGGTSTFAHQHGVLTRTAPAVSLRQVTEDQHVHRFSLVADVEGREWEMLDHDTEALARCEFAAIEIHESPGRSEAEFTAAMERHGLRSIDRRGSVVAYARGH